MIDTAWFGYSDKKSEGSWDWSDTGNSGEFISYQNWAEAEPNNEGDGEDCASMNADGTWNDQACDKTRKAFFCGFSEFFIVRLTDLKTKKVCFRHKLHNSIF